jgi:hypothetical protein
MNSQRLRYYHLLLRRKAELAAAGFENAANPVFGNHANGGLSSDYDSEFNVPKEPVSTNLGNAFLRSAENNTRMENEVTGLFNNDLNISRDSANDEENGIGRGSGYTVTQVSNYEDLDIIDIGDSDDDDEFNPEEFFVPHIPAVDQNFSFRALEVIEQEHLVTEKEEAHVWQGAPSVEMDTVEVDEAVDVFVNTATVIYSKEDSHPPTHIPPSNSTIGTMSPATVSSAERSPKRKISQSCRDLLESEKKRLRDLNYLSSTAQTTSNVFAVLTGKAHLGNEQHNKLAKKPESRDEMTNVSPETSALVPRKEDSVRDSALEVSSSSSSSSISFTDPAPAPAPAPTSGSASASSFQIGKEKMPSAGQSDVSPNRKRMMEERERLVSVSQKADTINTNKTMSNETQEKRPLVTTSAYSTTTVSTADVTPSLPNQRGENVVPVTENSNIASSLPSRDNSRYVGEISKTSSMSDDKMSHSKSHGSSAVGKSSIPPLQPKSRFNPNFASKGVFDDEAINPRSDQPIREERRISTDQASRVITSKPATQSSTLQNNDHGKNSKLSAVQLRAEKDKPLPHEANARSKDLPEATRVRSQDPDERDSSRRTERNLSSSSTASQRHQTKSLLLPNDRSTNGFSAEKHVPPESAQLQQNHSSALYEMPTYFQDDNRPQPFLSKKDVEEGQRHFLEKAKEREDQIKELLGSDDEPELPKIPTTDATTVVAENQPIGKISMLEDSIRKNSSIVSSSSSGQQNLTAASVAEYSSSSRDSLISVPSVTPIPLNVAQSAEVDTQRPSRKMDCENIKKLTLTNEELKIIHYLPNSFFSK